MINTEVLEAARKATGLSYGKARDLVRDALGPYCPTVATIHNYHRGESTPKHPDPLVVCALADIYKIDVSDVDATIAEQLESIRGLVSRSRCDSVVAGQSP